MAYNAGESGRLSKAADAGVVNAGGIGVIGDLLHDLYDGAGGRDVVDRSALDVYSSPVAPNRTDLERPRGDRTGV